jgi:hypothetical protein
MEHRLYCAAGLIATCAVLLTANYDPLKAGTNERLDTISDDALTLRKQLRWLLLSFAPTSLLLGVTTFIIQTSPPYRFFG